MNNSPYMTKYQLMTKYLTIQYITHTLENYYHQLPIENLWVEYTGRTHTVLY